MSVEAWAVRDKDGNYVIDSRWNDAEAQWLAVRDLYPRIKSKAHAERIGYKAVRVRITEIEERGE